MKINKYQATLLLALKDTRQRHGKWRPEITEELDSPRTTVHNNLVKLKEKGLVRKYSGERETRGRPKVYWYLTPKGHKAVEIIQQQIRVNHIKNGRVKRGTAAD
jgi:predicted ArsR family transcriptional regulator